MPATPKTRTRPAVRYRFQGRRLPDGKPFEPVRLREIPALAREVLSGEGDEICLIACVTRVQVDGAEETVEESAGWARIDEGRIRLDLYCEALFPA